MLSSEILQTQLLVHALNSPYLALEIIGRDTKAIFRGNKKGILVARLLVKYFSVNQERLTKTVLNQMASERLDIDVRNNSISQEDEMGYYKYINSLFETEPDNSMALMTALDKFVSKRLSEAMILRDSRMSAEDPDYDLTDHIQKDSQEIASLDVTGQKDKIVSIYDDMDTKIKAYEDMALNQISMGLPSMDNILEGGLARGEVGMVAASSGTGKTSVLSAFSINYAMHGKNVLHITLEEKDARMYLRFDKATLGLTSNDIITKKKEPDGNNKIIVNESFKEKAKKYYGMMNSSKSFGKLLFYRKMPHTMTIDKVNQLIISAEREYDLKIDVVVMDYPDLLANPSATGDESRDGGILYEDLRKMADQRDVVLWTASQLGRKASDEERKSLNSIQGSFRKKDAVEFAAVINHTDLEREHGFMRLTVDKLRNNDGHAVDTLYFKYNPETMRLSDESEAEMTEHKDLLQQSESDGKNNRKEFVGKQESFAQKTQEKASKFNNKIMSAIP